MQELDGAALKRADLATGIVIAVLGLAVTGLSLQMPTFVDRGANPLTAPGIYPGVVGLFLLICGAILTARSLRRGQAGTGQAEPQSGILRVLLGLVLMLVAVALVGRIPFWAVATGFTVVFSALFLDWRVPRSALAARLAAVAITVAIAGAAIPLLFEQVFLVRLP